MAGRNKKQNKMGFVASASLIDFEVSLKERLWMWIFETRKQIRKKMQI